MWVITGDQQRLVFVDPKGMRQEDHPHFNEKINLHTKLREVTEPALCQKGVKNLTLDAYIISATEYDELKRKVCSKEDMWTREQFEKAHILFFDSDYL